MPYADDPFALVIFGASGDLTRRKLVPALWSLYAARTGVEVEHKEKVEV